MSIPSNILGRFNSYSYHHILIACSNNDVANALAEVTDISQFEHNSPQGKYTPVNVGQAGSYVVLINSMTDAEFYIDDISWGSVFVPSGSSESTYDFNSAEVDGELNIIEPNGMRFINVLAETATRLNIAVPSMAFLIKTVFVGQLGNGEVETISGIRPFSFTMVDLSATFDYTGAQYKISLVGGRDGYAKHPSISHVLGGKSQSIKKGESVGAALKRLEAIANEVYNLRKDKTVAERKAALEKAGSTADYVEGVDYLPLVYTINYDPTFDTYEAATNEPDNTGEQDGGTTVSYQPDLSIHAAITKIMETSAKLMNHTSTGYEKDGTNRKFTYKITDEVHTTNDKMYVNLYVKYYELTTTLEDPDQPLGTNVLPPQDHVIEFEYLYTGKNVDILDFKMDMDLALAYFMTLQANRPLDRGQAETTAGIKTDDKDGNTDQVQALGTNTALGQTLKGPLLVGPQIQNSATKKVNVVETANARNVLASFAQMSTIGVTLKIVGNPALLEQIATLTANNPRDSVTRDNINADTTEDFSIDWSNIPGYCKIKIRMPSSPDQPGVYEPFWYQGYYRINSVQHSFSDGEFTQTLELFSMPVSTSFSNNNATSGEPPSPTEAKSPSADQIEIPSYVQSDSTNVPSVLYSKYDDLIVTAANKYNVDPMVMRGLFKQESNFNPSAVNKYSKATGMGQLMVGAATDVGLKTSVYPDKTPIPGQDERLDAAKNIDGATNYLSRMYRATGSYEEALAAYNTGLGNLRKYGFARVTSPSWNGDGETGNYVKKILGYVALAQPVQASIPDTPNGPLLTSLTPREVLEGNAKGLLK